MKRALSGPAAFLAALFCAQAATALEIGVAPSTTKVLPQNPLPGSKSAALEAAANEWEAFQIVLKSDTAVKNVTVTLSDLTGPGSVNIPASGAKLYREHFLDVTTPSPFSLPLHERRTGLYPDPLIPFFDPYKPGNVPVGSPFDLPAGGTAAVFVDIHVPRSSPPGLYAGIAKVQAEGIPEIQIPVSVNVWEFGIPSERTVGTAFGVDQYRFGKFHGGGSAGLEQIADRYYQALHEHRIDPTGVPGPVNFSFDGSGNLLPVDWSAYDAAVGPWMDGSKFGDGIGVHSYNVSHFPPGFGQGSMTADQWAKAAAAFAGHLESRGWWKRSYIYALDEPWLNGGDKAYEQIKNDCALLGKYTDLWKGRVLVTSPFDERLAGSVGIWCPVTPMYEGWFWVGQPKPGRAVYEQRLALGERLWFYVCNANNPPYAGYDIDTAIGYEPRIAKWGVWYERASGFLYWLVNYWVKDDPWNVLLDRDTFGALGARNGDGFILYPGDHSGTASPKGSPPEVSMDGPVVSYRMKMIRDGLEDWELFNLLKNAGGGEYARSQISRAYTRFGDPFAIGCEYEGWYCPERQPWTLDPAVMEDARRNVAKKLLYLLYPDRYPDPEILPDAGAEDSGAEDAGADSGADSGLEAGDAGVTSDGGEGKRPAGCSCSTII